MVVTSNKATSGDKELNVDWPIEEGIELGTTRRRTTVDHLDADIKLSGFEPLIDD